MLCVGPGSDGCSCFLQPNCEASWCLLGAGRRRRVLAWPLGYRLGGRHFASLVIQWTMPLGRRRGVGLYQAGVRAQQPTGLPRGTGAVWPPSYLRSSYACLPVSLCSQHMASPAVSSGFQPALFWQVGCCALFLGLQLDLCLPASLGGCGVLLKLTSPWVALPRAGFAFPPLQR